MLFSIIVHIVNSHCATMTLESCLNFTPNALKIRLLMVINFNRVRLGLKNRINCEFKLLKNINSPKMNIYIF